ncbi:hypothetical protein SADUNF_Sadunf06G0156200 [Salix dunnii]|uniref:Uncharacterized protein n=1 Tax=Salix dunnii TaxID=1413687 RepID=A0A835K7J2_9ROSI|nr:hypothetical protein SADUNF_Sadunf06G0156200 [Salix dunnii]
MNSSRILAFKNRPPSQVDPIPFDNVLSIALGRTVFLWNVSNGSISELVTVDEGDGPVTSVSWASEGHTDLMLRTLRGHRLRINSLAWNNHMLTIGGMGVKVMNNDVRIREHIVGTYRGHQQEFNGLLEFNDLLASQASKPHSKCESAFCALEWNKHEQELLSSHGFEENQIILWKYSSMVKMAELSGHTS